MQEILSDEDDADEGLAVVVGSNAYADVGQPLPAYRAPSTVRAGNVTFSSNLPDKASRGKVPPEATTSIPALKLLFMYAHGDDVW